MDSAYLGAATHAPDDLRADLDAVGRYTFITKTIFLIRVSNCPYLTGLSAVFLQNILQGTARPQTIAVQENRLREKT